MRCQPLLPLALFGSLASLASAAPATVAAEKRNEVDMNACRIIEHIMPTSVSCDKATVKPGDCRTAAQAADFFINAMQKYNLYAPGQIAGILAVTAVESVELKYKHNISPGRAGQGTANMQMINYNLLYARSIPELKPKVDAITTSPTAEGLTDAQANAVLELVVPDEYNFASAAWFLATQCTEAVRTSLATGSDAGWAAYMGCIGVPADNPERVAYWTKAKQAFGLA